jgi:hypothetical protein
VAKPAPKLFYISALVIALAAGIYTWFNRCDQGAILLSAVLVPAALGLGAGFTVEARGNPKSRPQRIILSWVIGVVVAAMVFSLFMYAQSKAVTGLTACYNF